MDVSVLDLTAAKEGAPADGELRLEDTALDGALGRLKAVLDELAPVVVAFSGGADSAFLAAVAHRHLGPDRVRVATAVSPSLASSELDDCRSLAQEWGLDWHQVLTHEMEDAAYARNDPDRCAHCKSALMDAIEVLTGPVLAEPVDVPGDAAPVGDGPTVVLGVNLDDLGDHRPGQAAAASRGARFPLVEAGFTKAMVRETSRLLGLRTWDKPAAACLASRLPYGVPVTMGRLSSVERAESALRGLGFDSLRVRHYEQTARIEVPLDCLPRMLSHRTEVVDAVKAAGYRYVTVDLEGLRSGNLNDGVSR